MRRARGRSPRVGRVPGHAASRRWTSTPCCARHPKVALVDELAHTNVPGSGATPSAGRTSSSILDAGIDVITTVNIQHLESIADAVEQMTGAQVRERVPDWVVRKADQIELVDSSPEQLRRRMLHGNIYPPAKVPQALTHFFRTDNLIALRELALRFLADETEEELLEHLRRHQTQVLWETTERIMVAVTAAPGTDAIVRRAARMAARVKGDLDVVHVVAGDGAARAHDQQLAVLRQLAADVGARLARDPGRRPRRGDHRLRPRPPDHPDRHRVQPAQPVAGAHGRRLDRPEDLPAGRRGRDRRAHHRPARRHPRTIGDHGARGRVVAKTARSLAYGIVSIPAR